MLPVNRPLRLARSALLAVALSVAAMPALGDSRLIATWVTEQGPDGMSGGTLTLKKSGVMKMQPDGFPEMRGTWVVEKGGMLVMTIPHKGESAAGFHLAKKGRELTLRYPDGTKQVFARSAGSSAGAKAGPRKEQ